MKFELGQTYICTASYDYWWTVGKEYEVQLRNGKRPCLVDDENFAWYEYGGYELTAEFKLKERKNMLELKENEVYRCTASDVYWFTTGKEYKTITVGGESFIADDEHDFYNDEMMQDELNQNYLSFELVRIEKPKVYVMINDETVEIVATGLSRAAVLKAGAEQDVYFADEKDFGKNYKERYSIVIHDLLK